MAEMCSSRIEYLDKEMRKIADEKKPRPVTEYESGYIAGLTQVVGWALGENAMNPLKLLPGKWDHYV